MSEDDYIKLPGGSLVGAKNFSANGCWPEKWFIETFGDMQLGEFIAKYTYSFGDFYKDNPETMKSFIERESRSYKGHYIMYVLFGRDDAETIGITREHDRIEVTTKPNGESRSWLEIGTNKEYQYQNGQTYEKWLKDQLRYPQHDNWRLGVSRDFIGEYIKWRIIIALDYPLAIRVISRGPIIQNEFVDTTERTIWKPR